MTAQSHELDQIGWIDLEFSRSEHLLAVGAVLGDQSMHFRDLSNSGQRQRALEQVDRLFKRASFLGGHNVVDFDLPKLRAIAPKLRMLRLGVIDTLPLSAIAFPQKPYHKLVKGYKLVHDSISNPVRDCELARKVAEQAFEVLAREPDTWTRVLGRLLVESRSYEAIGQLVLRIAGDESEGSVQDIARSVLEGRACPRGVETFLSNARFGESWALLFAWLRVAGSGSALPMWVLHRWPHLQEAVAVLRGRSCRSASCDFCRERHEPSGYLPRFGITTGFRQTPTTADGKGSLQEQIVRSICFGESVMALLPTGAGKSLCFQLPALQRYEATGDLTVAISPLQSLMKDQVDGIEARLGARLAEAISGLLSPIERRIAFDRVAGGEVAILYISPEQLRNPSIDALLKTRRIGLWVFDEAHCISKWGHDFRPDYLFVSQVIRRLSGDATPQVCAMTATAKLDVRAEITAHFKDELGIDLLCFDGGSERENLQYAVRRVAPETKMPEIVGLIRSEPEGTPVVVFARSRKHTEELAGYLTEHGLRARFFHAGLESEEKREIQQQFLDNEVQVICATNAFGMGVDKPDVRLVIHYDVPGSLENYLQEAGRAGRDRGTAKCILLFTDDDLDAQFRMGAYSALTKKDVQQILRALRRLAKRSKEGEFNEFFVTVGEVLSEEKELGEDFQATKVKTAIAWLERRGFLERKMNQNIVWSGIPTVDDIEEAESRIAELDLSPLARGQWLAVMDRLLSDGTGEPVSSDDLAGCLPSEDSPTDSDLPPRIMTILHDMEKSGLLKQIATYTLFFDAGTAQDSMWRLEAVERSQRAFFRWMQELDPDAPVGQPLRMDFSAAEAAIRGALPGTAEGMVSPITRGLAESLLACVARDGLAWEDGAKGLTTRSVGPREAEILLRFDLPRLQELGERRLALMRRISEAAREKLRAASVRGRQLKLEMTLDDLKALIAGDLFLGAQVHDEDAAIEGAIYALDRLGVCTVRGGRSVIRQAMGLRFIENSKGRRFGNQDYEELNHHYEEKTLQVHVMGTFARWGPERLAEAMRLVVDYFASSRDDFVARYRDALGTGLDVPADRSTVDKIVSALKDPEQEDIVTAADDANLLVLAGPGSGKTRTLVHRIAYLVKVRRVPPWRIFVLTFNRMAAELVRRRLREIVGFDDARRVRVHTYHALALRTLGLSLEAESLRDPGSGLQLSDLIPLATRVIGGEQTVLGVDAERAHEMLLGNVAHLLVDEYQDINLEQYELVSAIARRVETEEDARPTIFAVGDDDQNIYEWNDTSTEFIRRFEEDYKAQRKLLTSNYRSTAAIVDASQRLIRTNRDRMKSDVSLHVDAARRDDKQGKSVANLSIPDSDNEIGILMSQLTSWIDAGADPSSMAVLARRNDVLHALRHACETEGIPVRLAIPGAGIGRLARVRECDRFLTHLRELGEESVTLPMSAEALERLRDGGQRTQWDVLLERLIGAYWGGLNETDPVPARLLKESIQEALFEAAREFTHGAGVFLATIHASKGLEFDRVLMPASGWVRDQADESMEAERRLLYVGMTRARHEAVICSTAGHPFHSEIVGCGAESRPMLSSSIPVQIGDVRYDVLGLSDINLGYPGWFAEGHTIHRDLDRCLAGSEVELRPEDDRVGIFRNDKRIGRLSRAAAQRWQPRLRRIQDARVTALIERSDRQGSPSPHEYKCSHWEIPIIEVRWAP